MDQKTEDWIEQHAELLSRLSEIEPKVEFGTIIIRKEKGCIAGLDTCQVTREDFGGIRGKYSEAAQKWR